MNPEVLQTSLMNHLPFGFEEFAMEAMAKL